MVRLFAVLLGLLFAATSYAGDAIVSWEHPTQYVDGTTIPANGIARTEIQYGKCDAAKTGFLPDPVATIIPVNHPTKTYTVPSLGAGDWCFRARTIGSASIDNTSEWTAMVWKTVIMQLGPPISIRVQ